MSDISNPENMALDIQEATKFYNKEALVLNKLNLRVGHGEMYCLVGPSGCGKTTLIDCILGLKSINGGKILIFGRNSGAQENHIPGSGVGYMPQEVGLHVQFTIVEQLEYYGRIYGMKGKGLQQRIEHLISIVGLPDKHTLISNLSGGEQRRLSLLVAVLHKPPLLLLDEPTVGVDPVLRENIIDYLISLKHEGISILVTTHYIDEAKMFDKVGFFRNGSILCEGTPSKVMEHFGCQNLELAFLKLCKAENDVKRQQISPESDLTTDQMTVTTESDSTHLTEITLLSKKTLNATDVNFNNYARNGSMDGSMVQKVLSACQRTMLTNLRNPLFFLMQILFPIVQLFLPNLTLGRDPIGVKIGVFNGEMPSWGRSNTCMNTTFLSCKFLSEYVPKNMEWLNYESRDDARHSTELGNTMGYFIIPENYTQSLYDRAIFGMNTENETLENSIIHVHLDMSAQPNSMFIIKEMTNQYMKFLSHLSEEYGESSARLKLPLKLNYIYGSEDTGWEDYMTPSSILFNIALISTIHGIAYVVDKRTGLLNRGIVAGLKPWHFLLGTLLTGSVIIVMQSAITLLAVRYLLQTTQIGSWALCFLFSYLMGIVGVSVGFLFASICDIELEYVALEVFFVGSLLVNGTMTWPLEATSGIVRFICNINPLTIPLQSLRSIFSRGFGLEKLIVLKGILSLASLSAVCCCLSVLIMQHRILASRKSSG